MDVEGQGGGKTLDVEGQGTGRVLKIRQFSWTSYVCRPLDKKKEHYRILSFKRLGRLYIFFDFGVGVCWRGALNREGRLFKKLDFLSNSLLLLEAIQ